LPKEQEHDAVVKESQGDPSADFIKMKKKKWREVCVDFLPAYSKTTKKFVAEGFCLGYCTQTSVVHLLRIQLHSILGEVEPFLNNWC
jgi:hypothetical protein